MLKEKRPYYQLRCLEKDLFCLINLISTYCGHILAFLPCTIRIFEINKLVDRNAIRGYVFVIPNTIYDATYVASFISVNYDPLKSHNKISD